MGKINGLNSLLKKLDSLGGDIEETLFNSLNEAGKFVQREAKNECKVDIGDLKKSINCTTVQENNKISSVVSTNMPQAIYTEFGTGPKGEYTPVADKYPGNLNYHQGPWYIHEDKMEEIGIADRYNFPYFIGEDGKKMYIMYGQPAKPFLYPALKNNKDEIVKNIKEDLQEAIKKVSK